MANEAPEAKLRGRPKSVAAASHDVILDTVYAILQTKSVRDLTIEEVAREAKVGKPTIYKWWPSKAALVMDMFEERLGGKLKVPDATSAEQAIRTQVSGLIRLLNGFFGKVTSEIIAEGQSEPDVLREYRERYQSRRRAFTLNAIAAAKTNGEFRKDVDPSLLIDMIYGPIYYRLLVGHEKIDKRFGDQLVDLAMRYAKAK